MATYDLTETEPIAGAAGAEIRGVVRRRGIRLGVGDRSFVVERRQPVAILVQQQMGERRVDIPQAHRNPLPLLAPVVGYALIRALTFRRRKRK